jgi:hypothetical protein
MTTATKPIEAYVEKIKKHLLRKYPHMTFETVRLADDDVYLYFDNFEPSDYSHEVIHRASAIAVDALVEADYAISVFPAHTVPPIPRSRIT